MTGGAGQAGQTSPDPSGWRIFLYTLNIWPLTIAQQPMLFMAPYFSATFGLSLPVLGAWLTAGRIFDVIADVTVAFLSDRFRAVLGRKIWMIVGSLLMLPALWLLFVPGDGMTMTRYAVGLFLFFLSWTMAFIPYLVHGTELATGHAKRAAINILQGIGNSVALLVSYALPLAFVLPQMQPWREALSRRLSSSGWAWLDGVAALLGAEPQAGVAGYGLTMLMIVAITTLIAPVLLIGYAFFVPDRALGQRMEKSSAFAAFQNPVFLRFAIGYLFVASAYFVTLFMLPFLLTFIYFRPGELLQFSLLMTVTQVLAAPFWYMLLARLERRTCLTLAGIVQSIAIVLFMVTPANNTTLLFLDYFAFGLTGQTLMMGPFLVASDSADYSRWKTRKDSRAVHISLISLLIKAGSVAGALFVSLVGLAGLQPSLPVQAPSALVALQALGLWVPLGFMLLGSAIIWTHPITRNRQRALQRRIELRSLKA
jgi:Na+/melibiose symporter-like transporter